MTYFFEVIYKKIISETVRASTKDVWDICRFWHLPLHGVIVKIALHDRDLLFEGKKLKFRKLYFVALTYFLKVTDLKFVYLWIGES